MATTTVTCVADLFEALQSAERELGSVQLWFRGHSRRSWKLLPSAFRRPPELEAQSMHLFRAGARVRHTACPRKDEHGAWLTLMQHYGLPTRLLDWTESPLTALYFAILHEQVDDTEDACLWMLSPGALNQAVGTNSIPLLDGELVAPIAANAFDHDKKGLDSIAVLADHVDLRMLVQLSRFTIHGHSTPLEDVGDSDEYLFHAIIPGKAREQLARELRLLGITRSALFPDLTNLARDLAELRLIPPDE